MVYIYVILYIYNNIIYIYIYTHTHTFVDTASFYPSSSDPAVNCSLERRPTKSGSERRQRSYVWQVTCVAYLCGTCCKYEIHLYACFV